MSVDVCVGVDLGGTRTRAAVVDESGKVSEIHQRLTRAERPALSIVDDVADLVREVTSRGSMKVGVGVPTTLDEAGRLRPCLNLPTFRSFALREELESRLGEPVRLENDASCFALGERAWGAARGAHAAIGLTLGTSVGLGIILEGVVFHGAHGEAGEIWRSPARLLSGGPLDEDVHTLLGGRAISRGYTARTGKSLDPAAIAELAARGDGDAMATFAGYGTDLGKVLCWLCDVLDPDLAVIGGAVASSSALFLPSVMTAMKSRRCTVAASVLGDRAAILGAASLFLGTGGIT
jgi:predicted NBD/HSP70 family sugar kinase